MSIEHITGMGAISGFNERNAEQEQQAPQPDTAGLLGAPGIDQAVCDVADARDAARARQQHHGRGTDQQAADQSGNRGEIAHVKEIQETRKPAGRCGSLPVCQSLRLSG